MAHAYIKHICSFLNKFSFYRAETLGIDRAGICSKNISANDNIEKK